MSDNFLIIGGNGFLGFHIVEDLIEQGKTVSIFDISKSKDSEQLSFIEKHKIKTYVGDLCSKDDIMNAFKDSSITCVINTASPPPLSKNFDLFQKVNVEGAKNVLDCCVACGVKKYILTSSVGVTNEDHDVINGTEETTSYVDETCPNPYYLSKMKQEKLVLSYNGKNGLMTVSIRPHRIFGPRDVTLIPRLVETANAGRDKFYLGTGQNLVDWTYVKNVVHAHILASEKLVSPNQAPAGNFYFITNDEPIKFWEFIGHFWEGLGYGRPYIGIPYFLLWIIASLLMLFYWVLRFLRISNSYPPTEFELGNLNLIVANRYYDISKAKKDLGYKPKLNMKQGIEETIKYFSYLRKDAKKSK